MMSFLNIFAFVLLLAFGNDCGTIGTMLLRGKTEAMVEQVFGSPVGDVTSPTPFGVFQKREGKQRCQDPL
jgi:hypothetical protein